MRWLEKAKSSEQKTLCIGIAATLFTAFIFSI
jgi:hypothetical protein